MTDADMGPTGNNTGPQWSATGATGAAGQTGSHPGSTPQGPTSGPPAGQGGTAAPTQNLPPPYPSSHQPPSGNVSLRIDNDSIQVLIFA